MNWLEEEIAHHLNFTQDDLLANQEEHLSTRQLKRLRGRTISFIALGILPYLLFLGTFLSLLVDVIRGVSRAPFTIISMLVLGAFSIFAALSILMDLWSLYHNSVSIIEGAAKTVLGTRDSRDSRNRLVQKFSYLLRVTDDSGNQRSFPVTSAAESLSKRPRWRIYYSPRFKEFLSIEVVEENPQPFMTTNFVTDIK